MKFRNFERVEKVGFEYEFYEMVLFCLWEINGIETGPLFQLVCVGRFGRRPSRQMACLRRLLSECFHSDTTDLNLSSCFL